MIDYPGELTTRTADLTISELLWDSVIITEDGRLMGIEIRNFYLSTPFDRFKYINMAIKLIPQHIVN